MTELCDWIALACFFAAFIVAGFSTGRHWATFIAAGLTAYVLPVALTAAHVLK